MRDYRSKIDGVSFVLTLLFLMFFSCYNMLSDAKAASVVVKIDNVEIKGKVFEEIEPVNVIIGIEGVSFSTYTSTNSLDWTDYMNLPKGLKATKIYWSSDKIVLKITGTPEEGIKDNIKVSIPYIAIKELEGQYNPAKSFDVCMTSDINESAVIDIEKIKVESIELPTAKSITYGDKFETVKFSNYTKEGVTLSILNENDIPNAGKNFVIIRLLYDDVKSHDYSSIEGYVKEDDSIVVRIPLTVKKRKLIYQSGSAEKKYDGISLSCKDVELISGSLVDGDEIDVVPYALLVGIGEIPNNCYIQPSENTLLENYDIQINPGTLKMTIGTRNYQPDPIKTDETILGKRDGTIKNVTSEMEYSLDNVHYWPIEGDNLSDLEPGTYYLRYKNNGYYEASDSTRVDILSGRKLKIVFFADNEIVAIRETEYEGTVKEIPEIPTRTGFDRKEPEWDFDSESKFVEDTPIYAIYYQNIYFITYELDGGEIKEEYTAFFRSGDVIDYPVYVRKKGLKFGGFYDNPQFTGNVLTSLPKEAKNDIVLYAKWVECEHDEDFVPATCMTLAHCNVCDEDFGEVLEHEWNENSTVVENGHAIFCKNGCGTIKEGSLEEHFVDHYEELDELKHVGICICGYSEYFEHEMVMEKTDDSEFHLSRCICGLVNYEAHSFGEWEATVDEEFIGHERKCICGYIERKMHSVEEWTETISPTVASEGSKEGICVVCGIMVYEIEPKLIPTPTPTLAPTMTPTPEVTSEPVITPASDKNSKGDFWSQVNQVFDFNEFAYKLKSKDQYAIIIAVSLSGGFLAVLLNIIVICVLIKSRRRQKNDNTKNSLN